MSCRPLQVYYRNSIDKIPSIEDIYNSLIHRGLFIGHSCIDYCPQVILYVENFKFFHSSIEGFLQVGYPQSTAIRNFFHCRCLLKLLYPHKEFQVLSFPYSNRNFLIFILSKVIYPLSKKHLNGYVFMGSSGGRLPKFNFINTLIQFYPK